MNLSTRIRMFKNMLAEQWKLPKGLRSQKDIDDFKRRINWLQETQKMIAK